MKPKRVLIADDDDRLLQAMTIRLEADGFQVRTARDAYQALQSAVTDVPDVLVLDINMPAGTGLSVQERIRALPREKHVPVVFVTGYSSPELDRKAHEIGAFAMIHKPFDFNDFVDTVNAAAQYGSPDEESLDAAA